jgi:nucleoside phosphorylase
MSKMNSETPYDVIVLCALGKEAKAFEDIVSQQCHVSFAFGMSKQGLSYRFTAIQNDYAEPLHILLSCLPRYGPLETVQLTHALVSEFRPGFVAMTGICAGDKRKVKLGDLVVAERAFMADSGKLILDKDSQKREYDTYTASASRDVLQFAQLYDIPRDLIGTLKSSPHEHPLPPECHIKPIASSNAVREDNPFEEVTVPVRGTVAIDMEGAAFYQAVESFPSTRSLLVKGVSDYADSDKNDDYQQYASELSALYMLSLIRAYIRSDTPLKPHIQKVKSIYTPSREGNRGIITFTLNGAQRTLVYTRHDNITHQIIVLEQGQQELVREIVPFATLKPLEKRLPFQIDRIDCLLTFKMSAITSIMSVKVEVGGIEVFRT